MNVTAPSLKASVVDLGYNSLKMVSYDVGPTGEYTAYDQRGELTKIGEGLDQTGFLAADAIDRTISVLRMFSEVTRLTRVDRVLAIATSAVREAGNGPQFVSEAEAQTGFRFRILTGEEEALFSYVGAARATRYPTCLFFDLGGGSLELSYSRAFRVKRLLSLPLGALRLTELYGRAGGGYSKKDYGRMKKRISDLLPTREELGLDDDTALIGVGGTLRALARYDQNLREYPLNKVHNYRLRRKSVTGIHKAVRRMNIEKLSRIEAFGKERADSITAGSLVVSMIMSRLGFEEVVVSTHGLRDGVLSEQLRDPRSYARDEFTRQAANACLADWRSRRPHNDFLHSLASRDIISAREEYILEEAIRSFMDLYLSTRPETLFYSVISRDSVLDHGEQLAAAVSLVRAKAPKMAEWFFEAYRSVLGGTDRESVDMMGAVIQLSEVLKLTGSRASLRLDRGVLRIEVASPMAEVFPELLLRLAAGELEKASGLRVRTRVTKVRPAKGEPATPQEIAR